MEEESRGWRWEVLLAVASSCGTVDAWRLRFRLAGREIFGKAAGDEL